MNRNIHRLSIVQCCRRLPATFRRTRSICLIIIHDHALSGLGGVVLTSETLRLHQIRRLNPNPFRRLLIPSDREPSLDLLNLLRCEPIFVLALPWWLRTDWKTLLRDPLRVLVDLVVLGVVLSKVGLYAVGLQILPVHYPARSGLRVPVSVVVECGFAVVRGKRTV
jgi:hypothetical protein